MNRIDLSGKTAIVTGAGTGIGRELALEFARAGASVVCCARRLSQIQGTVELIQAEGGHGAAITVDVTNKTQVDQLLAATLDQFGQIDLLFNNAGSFQWVGPIWEADPEVWWQDVTTNLFGSMLCSRAVLPHMMERNSGILINMDGGGGTSGANVGGSAYGASKAALVRFTEGLARELERAGSSVLAFTMHPGFVHTSMTEALVATPTGLEWQARVRRLIDTGGGKPPDACAKATMQLLRIASPELNGCSFSVETDFSDIEQRKAEIRANHLYVLGLRT